MKIGYCIGLLLSVELTGSDYVWFMSLVYYCSQTMCCLLSLTSPCCLYLPEPDPSPTTVKCLSLERGYPTTNIIIMQKVLIWMKHHIRNRVTFYLWQISEEGATQTLTKVWTCSLSTCYVSTCDILWHVEWLT